MTLQEAQSKLVEKITKPDLAHALIGLWIVVACLSIGSCIVYRLCLWILTP